MAGNLAGARERFGHVSIILWLINTAEFWERDEACWGSLRPSSYTAFNGLEDYEVSEGRDRLHLLMGRASKSHFKGKKEFVTISVISHINP